MASGSKKVIFAALIGNSLISVTKFIAASISGSSAMMSEGIHSLVDTGNQLLLLMGLKKAQKPADAQFPFGHGKEVYFWSFVVAIMIFGVGAGISIYEGIHSLQDPHVISNPMINYIVLGLAMIFEGFAWFFAWKEFKRTKGNISYYKAVRRQKDPVTFVVLFEDSAAMLGLIVAFLGVYLAQVTAMPFFDGIASIIIGLILGGTAIWLAHETKGLLIGESADIEIVNGIRSMTDEVESIQAVKEVLTLHMGPQYILVTINADFESAVNSDKVESDTAILSEKIKKTYPRVKRVFIEAEAG